MRKFYNQHPPNLSEENDIILNQLENCITSSDPGVSIFEMMHSKLIISMNKLRINWRDENKKKRHCQLMVCIIKVCAVVASMDPFKVYSEYLYVFIASLHHSTCKQGVQEYTVRRPMACKLWSCVLNLLCYEGCNIVLISHCTVTQIVLWAFWGGIAIP